MNEQYFTSLNGYLVKDENAVHTYDTIADMKSDTKLREGNHVKTKGYYSINDGGNGEYIIVDDDTLTDDGGSILRLDNGLYAKLLDNEQIYASQYGLIPDSKAEYINGEWVFTTGTDYGDLLNSLLEMQKPIILPIGTIYTTKPLLIRSGTIIKGLDDMSSTRILFNGNSDENLFESYNQNQEVSFYELANMRLTDIRTNPTSGYAINTNYADNHCLIHHMFIDNFASGGIYIGANTTSLASDCIIIDDIWGVITNKDNSLITIGNINNVCAISNIFCDGGKVFSRTAHGYNIGYINITNVKHEIIDDLTGSSSINIGNEDYIILNTITRRNNNATTGSEGGYIVNNISTRGVYVNCNALYGSAPYNGLFSSDLIFNSAEGAYYNSIFPVANIPKKCNFNGNYIHSKLTTLPTGTKGDIAFKEGYIYQKTTNASNNSDWLQLATLRVYDTINDVPKFHTPIGTMVYIINDHKAYWLNDITSTIMHWYDATGTLAYSINQ